MRGGLDDQGVVGAEEAHEAGEVLVLTSGGALGESHDGDKLHGFQLSLHGGLGVPHIGAIVLALMVQGKHPSIIVALLIHGLGQFPEQVHLSGVDGTPDLGLIVIFILVDLLLPVKAGG